MRVCGSTCDQKESENTKLILRSWLHWIIAGSGLELKNFKDPDTYMELKHQMVFNRNSTLNEHRIYRNAPTRREYTVGNRKQGALYLGSKRWQLNKTWKKKKVAPNRTTINLDFGSMKIVLSLAVRYPDLFRSENYIHTTGGTER